MNNSKFYISFVVLWTFVEAIVNLSGISQWNIWLLRTILFLIFFISISLYAYEKFNNRERYSTGNKLSKRVYKSLKKTYKFLTNENFNSNGQRLRLTPSIMESSTVIGAVYTVSNSIHVTPKINPNTIEWLFSSLKKQFKEQVVVKYFDCSRCNNNIVCNIAYFDYLSHFFYAKNTVLYAKFVDEFTFMSELLTNRLFEGKNKCGWSLFDTKTIDPLATATNLILHTIFPCLSKKQEMKVIKTLLKLQEKSGAAKGSWERDITDERWCAGQLTIITVHRVIEALMLIKSYHPQQELEIAKAIDLSVSFLKSSHAEENPVNYEFKMGVDDAEIMRGVGHIVQALVKAECNDFFVEQRVNFLLNSQKKNGSFIGKAGVLENDRELTNKTDLTAFIGRTLSIYYEAQSKS